MEGKEQPPPIKLKTYSKKQEVADISVNNSERFDIFMDTSEDISNLGNSLTEDAVSDGNLTNRGRSLQDSLHQCKVSPYMKAKLRLPFTKDTETKSVSDGNQSYLGISLHDASFEHLPNTAGQMFTSTPQKRNSVYDIDNDSFLEDFSPIKITKPCHESSINDTNDDSMVSSQLENSSECEKVTSFYDFEGVQLVKSSNSQKRRAIIAVQRPSKLLWKNTERSAIAKCKYTKCCDSICLAHFTLKSIETFRFKYWTKTRSERRQWLLEKVTGSCKNTSKRKFVLDSQNICTKAFMKIYNISKNVFYNLQQEAKRGVVVTSPKQGRREHGERYMVAMNWLEDYATYRGDRMPDSDTILLPYRTRRNRVYNLYKEEHSLPIHISTFSDMWKVFFPHLRIKKVNSFSKCTTCTSIERQLEKTLDMKKREKLLKLREEHNALQMGERKHYYRKREAARTRPDKFLSIIIDGMDQSKSNLPHFVGRIAKAVNPSDQLKTHITGIMAHSQNKFSTYVDMQEFPHDSNLTMNLLLKMMHKIWKEMGNRLPPVCYLQCDNCWRENKNRYMLGLCELLIHKRIFNEVYLSFLMVGHTHEDIDAAFSKIADTLRRTDAETLPQLLDLLPEDEEIKHVFNIRDWMAPNLNNIQKHTRPHHFKFQWDFQLQLVKSFYKGKESDAWKPLDCVLKQLPAGKPGSVAPNFENLQIQRIESHLSHWHCLFTDQISHSEVKWWKQFIASIKAKIQTPRTVPTRWIIPLFPQQPNTVESDDIEIPEGIQKLIDKDNEQPEVRVVQRK